MHWESSGKTVNEECWFSNEESEDECAIDSALPGFGKSETPWALYVCNYGEAEMQSHAHKQHFE